MYRAIGIMYKNYILLLVKIKELKNIVVIYHDKQICFWN